jgi:hypothetical protein
MGHGKTPAMGKTRATENTGHRKTQTNTDKQRQTRATEKHRQTQTNTAVFFWLFTDLEYADLR